MRKDTSGFRKPLQTLSREKAFVRVLSPPVGALILAVGSPVDYNPDGFNRKRRLEVSGRFLSGSTAAPFGSAWIPFEVFHRDARSNRKNSRKNDSALTSFCPQTSRFSRRKLIADFDVPHGCISPSQKIISGPSRREYRSDRSQLLQESLAGMDSEIPSLLTAAKDEFTGLLSPIHILDISRSIRIRYIRGTNGL